MTSHERETTATLQADFEREYAKPGLKPGLRLTKDAEGRYLDHNTGIAFWAYVRGKYWNRDREAVAFRYLVISSDGSDHDLYDNEQLAERVAQAIKGTVQPLFSIPPASAVEEFKDRLLKGLANFAENSGRGRDGYDAIADAVLMIDRGDFDNKEVKGA